jgi:hypothetical protein
MRIYLLDRFAEMQTTGIEDPLREQLPKANQEQLTSDTARDVAEAALFVYCAARILDGPHLPLEELASTWAAQLPPGYPGKEFLQIMLGDGQADELAARLPHAWALGELARGTCFGPKDLFTATVRFVEVLGRLASHQREAELPVDRWIATEWTQTIATQRFALISPSLNIPSIEQALARPPGLSRTAAVALTAAPAIGANLSGDLDPRSTSTGQLIAFCFPPQSRTFGRQFWRSNSRRSFSSSPLRARSFQYP